MELSRLKVVWFANPDETTPPPIPIIRRKNERILASVNNSKQEERCLLYPITSTIFCFRVYFDILPPFQQCPNYPSFHCPLEIATQISLDRLDLLLSLIRTWDGTISVSIFITNYEKDILFLFEKFLAFRCEIFGRVRIHLILGTPTDPYPINFLRNIALENGRKNYAPLVAVYDIDFIPSPSLCKKIMFWNSVHSLESLSNKLVSTPPVLPPIDPNCSKTIDLPNVTRYPKEQNRFMFILPSFEVLKKGRFYIPTTKQRLQFWYTAKIIARFHRFFEGQDMDLPKWFNATEPFFHSPSRMKNEHYAWFSWKQYQKISNENLCDEHYFDRGYNKIACYFQLRISGFIPVVIPDGWLIHEVSDVRHSLEGTNETRFRRRHNNRIYMSLFFANFCSKIEPFGWIKRLKACEICNGEEKVNAEFFNERTLCFSAMSYSQGISPAYNPSQASCLHQMHFKFRESSRLNQTKLNVFFNEPDVRIHHVQIPHSQQQFQKKPNELLPFKQISKSLNQILWRKETSKEKENMKEKE